MGNDSTGQFEGGEYLEAASFLSMAWFEGTGIFQHGSYAIGCKRTPKKTALFQKGKPKGEYYAMPRLISSHVVSKVISIGEYGMRKPV